MNKTKKEKLHGRMKTLGVILKFLLLIIIIVGIPLYLFFFQKTLIEQFSSIEALKAYFLQYKTLGIFIYIGAQIIQIVISIIPGQWLQLGAGAMYGFWLGYLYSIIGAFLGSILAYYLAKWLGHDAIHLFFGEEKIKRFMHRLNSKKAILIVFLIYLIPGLPKDLCNYAAGLSEMKLKPFLVVSLIGRSPGMMMSLLIGKELISGGYVVAIIIAVIALILFILGVIFRKKIMGLSDKAYEKLHLTE